MQGLVLWSLNTNCRIAKTSEISVMIIRGGADCYKTKPRLWLSCRSQLVQKSTGLHFMGFVPLHSRHSHWGIKTYFSYCEFSSCTFFKNRKWLFCLLFVTRVGKLLKAEGTWIRTSKLHCFVFCLRKNQMSALRYIQGMLCTGQVFHVFCQPGCKLTGPWLKHSQDLWGST